MSESNPTSKFVVTVAEMSRMVGLSRARFYQLIAADFFPSPCYDIDTRRPLYTEEQQLIILDARRRNMGINGRPVLFYAPRSVAPPRPTRSPRIAAERRRPNPVNQSILDAVKGLGLTTATVTAIEAAVTELYPAGTANVAEGEVVRAVFLHLRRQNSADNVRR